MYGKDVGFSESPFQTPYRIFTSDTNAWIVVRVPIDNLSPAGVHTESIPDGGTDIFIYPRTASNTRQLLNRAHIEKSSLYLESRR